ncbi:MAG: WG repeat-containing protein, partial [Candidatus Fimenecus sp.]
VAEFLKTQETVDSHPYAHAPKLLKVIPFPPERTERFALKLIFDNGETKKYVLPIDSTAQAEEAVQYRHYVFTDKIWQSAKIVSSRPSEYPDYPSRGQCIVFKNDFFISAYLGYTESKLYTEPRLCKETVYEDENIQLHKLWSWNAKYVYEDEETGLINASFSGNALNGRGGSTYVSRDGKRLTSLTFDYTNSFSEGLACVGIVGKGWGFIDESGELVIPPVYDQADDFKDGKAKVKRDGKYFFVDKTGREFEIAAGLDRNYQEIGELCEGFCRVSTLHLDYTTLAYYSELSEFAGIWGYVDENGNEVIPPQYIYAFDFTDGIALVCKGKWTIDKKWDSPHNIGNYWTEEELWGAIDRTGKEVIPFLFDSLEAFADTTEVFSAHYGGWETGKWGVISRTGEWLVEPIFSDIGPLYKDGLFFFGQEDAESDSEDILFGVYDLHQQKVIFEPQFSDVEFTDDGYLEVEVFEESLGRFVQKIIDLHGKEVFPSVYSFISAWREPYEVIIRDESGSRHGLIDKNGNVLLPCKYDIVWNGISYQKRRMVVPQDGKQAVIDFDENVIIPAEYYKIYGLDRPLLTVQDGDRDNYNEGLITHDGTVVIPPKYRRIDWCKENRILCCEEGDCVMLELVIKNKSKSDM